MIIGRRHMLIFSSVADTGEDIDRRRVHREAGEA
jgi:hypothetical protein